MTALPVVLDIIPVHQTIADAPVWRKARWTDAEPEVQRLLDLLPLLPEPQQQQVWQAWQTIWQTVTHPVGDGPDIPPWHGPRRRKLDSVPFGLDLLKQLSNVSSEVRQAWLQSVSFCIN
jgi:hypothetical protein